MADYLKKPIEQTTHTLQNKVKKTCQPPLQEVLQTYWNHKTPHFILPQNNSPASPVQRAELTPQEKDIVSLYMGENFRIPNQVLRGKASESSLQGADKLVFERLQGIIDKCTLEEDLTVYRACGKDAFEGLNEGSVITPGQIMKDRAFMSTSKNRSTAEFFFQPGRIILKMLLPTGTLAIDTEAEDFPAIGSAGESQEVIVSKGQSLRVKEVNNTVITKSEGSHQYQDINAVLLPPGSTSKGCCYITTACVERMGLPDDCEELTVLREFRDNYILSLPDGKKLVELYYKQAPGILNAIRRRKEEEEILDILYTIIKLCVEAIKNRNYEFAFKTYCRMVLTLNSLVQS